MHKQKISIMYMCLHNVYVCMLLFSILNGSCETHLSSHLASMQMRVAPSIEVLTLPQLPEGSPRLCACVCVFALLNVSVHNVSVYTLAQTIQAFCNFCNFCRPSERTLGSHGHALGHACCFYLAAGCVKFRTLQTCGECCHISHRSSHIELPSL